MAASSRVVMKEAVSEPAACIAGGTPALHSLARKTWERGRLARFVGLDTKLQSNHRETPKMTEILTPQT
jgi:hypothetical protein